MFGKEAPFSPGKKDIEAINAALVQEGANAATYAQAYKAARKAAWEEMQNKLAELKDKIFKGDITLKFGEDAFLPAGVFTDAVNEKIFEDKKAMLA